MTPAAVTQGLRKGSRGPGRAAAHARPVRAPHAPRAPRRLSGPLRGQSVGRRPVSLASRVADFVRALPDHSLLDRIVRGRAWIPLLGVMLAGIVATQVELLKLNASMGRSITLATSLQARNELLRTSVSSLSDPKRIERLATRMGMVMPGPTEIDFLRGRANVAKSIAGIHAPDAAAFSSALQASTALAGAAVTPPATTPTTTATPAATATGSTATTPATTTSSAAAATAPSTSTPSTATPTAAASTGTAATGGASGTTTTTGATSAPSNPGGAAPAG